MKKIDLILALSLISVYVMAQTPQAFKYQAVVRNNSGIIIQNHNVAFRVSILTYTGSGSTTTVYQERHIATTNEFGLASLDIGRGEILLGPFSAIDWSTGQMLIQIELDTEGGTNYQLMGTSEMLAVPFAIYSEKSRDNPWNKNGNDIYYEDGNVSIGTDNPSSTAALDITSGSKGLLPPRLTYEQRKAISEPAEGLIVYCTNCNADGSGLLSIYDGENWKGMSPTCIVPLAPDAGPGLSDFEQIVWNWSPVPIADGYKWNTNDNYETALDLWNNITYIEGNMIPCGIYHRYIWAYNSCGHSPSMMLTDTTSCFLEGSGVTDINGNFYPTIILGAQEWMGKNLETINYQNGDPIPFVEDAQEWGALTSGAYCLFNSNWFCGSSWPGIYGSIYNWFAVNDPRNICPLGWHLPTYNEWIFLRNYIGENGSGNKIKSLEYWLDNCIHNNISGFNALPIGQRDYFGLYLYEYCNSTSFWSSTVFPPVQAWSVLSPCTGEPTDSDSDLLIQLQYMKSGLSVRCIKDQ